MGVERLPGESADYLGVRERLLEAEIELKEQRERVAELRRQLPAGAEVDDYLLTESVGEGVVREVRMSELFEDPGRPLILIHFMYGGAQESACPMCSMWADGYNAVAPHVRRRANFAVVAEAEPERLRQLAESRGWMGLRFLSSSGTGLKDALRMQDEDRAQRPGVSVLLRDGEERLRHFYTSEAQMSPQHWRGVDLLSPVWHLFDLLPDGRGDWFPSLSYDQEEGRRS